MTYNFKSTIDDYMLQWFTAFYTGRTEIAENLLAAVKRHDRFSKSWEIRVAEWEIRVAEAETFVSEVEAIPSDRLIHFWNEMKSDLEAFPHECNPHPCAICSEKAALLTMGAFTTETYQDAIHHASQWIRLYEDDIVGRALHATALYTLGVGSIELSTNALNSAKAVEQSTQDSTPIGTVGYFTRALEELQVATRLIQDLPDDKVYFAKYIRPKAPDFYKQLKQVEFTQDLDPLDIGTPKEEDLSDFDPLAIPADDFRRMLKQLTAQTLRKLNRHEEALSLLQEILQEARNLNDKEAIASLLVTLSGTLLEIHRYQEALPILYEALAHNSDDKEIIFLLLSGLSVTLRELNRHEEALPLLQEVLQEARNSGNESQVNSLRAMLAETLLKLDRHEEALPLFQEVLQEARNSGNESQVNSLRARLVVMLLKLDREEEALPLLRESLEYEKTLKKIES